jgi:hypothetical protein
MKHIRGSLLVAVVIVAALAIWSGVATAGIDYPPSTRATTTTDDPDHRSTTTAATLVPAQAGQGQAGALAFTGSDRTLLWVGLGLLTAGTVAFVSTRRRAELRRQASIRSLG